MEMSHFPVASYGLGLDHLSCGLGLCVLMAFSAFIPSRVHTHKKGNESPDGFVLVYNFGSVGNFV